jgi:hypothetical protein
MSPVLSRIHPDILISRELPSCIDGAKRFNDGAKRFNDGAKRFKGEENTLTMRIEYSVN